VTRLADQEVLRLRLAAQRLHRQGRPSVPDLVRHLGGVQAQILPPSGLALGVRSNNLTKAAVDRARLQDRSIVLNWAMRGTLHLLAAEDHGWLLPLLLQPDVANAHRRLLQEGMPAGQTAPALVLIERMLSEGPLTRPEIAERLEQSGIHTQGQAIAHLVWLAAATGRTCFGPERGGRPTYVLVRDWLGETKPRERGDPLQELAVRYLAAHGPATPEDLAFWSGVRLGEARSAWKAIAGRLVEVATAGGPRWRLRGKPKPAAAGLVRLLPAFDEYPLGWRDRGLIAAPENWKTVNRGGGWIYPVVLHDGRLIGTWRSAVKGSQMTVKVMPFVTLEPAVEQGLETERARLAKFLGRPVEPI
jgi:hypothetical protein